MADEKGDPKPAASVRERIPLGEVTIEIAHPKNAQVLFGPTSQVLRGRWEIHNLNPGDTSTSGVTQLPTIPGFYVTVNQATRTCKVEDPLSFPENRQLMIDVNRMMKGIFNSEHHPHAAIERTGVDDNEMASWVYWMMRLCKDRHARIIGSGRLPADEGEIKKLFPGSQIKKKFFDMYEELSRQMLKESNQMLAAMEAQT